MPHSYHSRTLRMVSEKKEEIAQAQTHWRVLSSKNCSFQILLLHFVTLSSAVDSLDLTLSSSSHSLYHNIHQTGHTTFHSSETRASLTNFIIQLLIHQGLVTCSPSRKKDLIPKWLTQLEFSLEFTCSKTQKAYTLILLNWSFQYFEAA